MQKIIINSLLTATSIPTLKYLYTTPKQEILFSGQQKIKPNPAHNEMKTALQEKEDKHKSTQQQQANKKQNQQSQNKKTSKTNKGKNRKK